MVSNMICVHADEKLPNDYNGLNDTLVFKSDKANILNLEYLNISHNVS